MSVVIQSKAVQERGTQTPQNRGDQQTGTTTKSYKRIHMPFVMIVMIMMMMMMMGRRMVVMMMTHLLVFSYTNHNDKKSHH